MENQKKPDIFEISVNMPSGKMIEHKDDNGSTVLDSFKKPVMVAEFKNKTIRLNHPNFDQYQGAMLAMETPSGKSAKIYAGNFILTACVLNEDREILEEIKKDVKAHVAVCLDAYDTLNLYTSELKKK